MDVEFDGLLSLLGERLYADKRVFIREMIQNGSDSILRLPYGQGGANRGRIDVEVVPSERRITFRDDGLGMNEADLRAYLSTIAASGTRKAKTEGASTDLIGQHGIGFLSAFVVAERVRVRTRKQGDASGWQWENQNRLDYTLTPLDDLGPSFPSHGTAVDVFVKKDDAIDLVAENTVREILQKYCDLLLTPIHLNGSRVQVNTGVMPWEREQRDDKTRLLDIRTYLDRTQPDAVLEVIPFDFKDGVRASGVLYITTTRTFQIEAPRYVKLYQSRMLLTSNATELLPKWATFISGVIDSSDVAPNAARDDFVRNAAADELTDRLGARIIEYLTALHRDDPARFRQIVEYHNLGLMAACYYHEGLLNRFYDLLLWRVNVKPFGDAPQPDAWGEESEGTWHTLGEILEVLAPGRSGQIDVPTISDGVAARQYFEMANAANAVIVDTSAYFADDLLRKVESLPDTSRLGDRKIRIVSVTDDGADVLFKPPTAGEDDAVRLLAAFFDQKVDVSGVRLRVEAARTLPDSVVGVVRTQSNVTPDLMSARRLSEDMLASESVRTLARELLRLKRRENIRLILNAANPLVRKLATSWQRAIAGGGSADVGTEKLFRDLAPSLYNIAILNSRAVLSESGQKLLGRQYADLIDRLLDSLDRVRHLEIERAEASAELARLAPTPAQPKRDYLSVFYMTPFAAEFSAVRDAVRKVVEGRWGARLWIATDSIRDEILIENLRSHIEDADAFIADITGFNVNVMLELGAVKFDMRRRPVIIVHNGMKATDMPADLRGMLWIDYAGRSGADLQAYLFSQTRKMESIAKLLEDERLTRAMSEARLREMIEESGLNAARFDLPALVRAFPTERAWRQATEDAVAAKLPDALKRRGGDILEAVRAGMSR